MIGQLIWQFIKWHKIIGDKVATRLFDRPLPPPTARERELEAELRATLAADSGGAPLPTWQKFRDQMRRDLDAHDPRTFLRWPIIQHAMCLTNSGIVVPEYFGLRLSGQWARFEPAVQESPTGNPIRFLYYPRSSGSLLHHCHHVLRFEEMTGANLPAMDVVVEFGGGYGSMCRLLHRLGFRGRYFIFDLPEFSALQRYFLKSLGLPVRDGTADVSGPGIYLFTDLEALRAALGTLPGESKKTFLATWSLSESPTELRDRFLPLVAAFDYFLIAYQDRFYEVDNNEYFGGFERSTAGKIDWQTRRLRHLPGNSYFFGKRHE